MQLGPHERQADGEEMKKLRKGVHWVKMPHCAGKRKVKVLANGKWRFMKGRRGGKRSKSGRHWVPGHYTR